MKRFKRVFAVLIIAFLLVGMLTAFAGCNSDKESETLIVYNWADYIDTSLIAEFEEYYQSVTGKELTVVYSTFDTNETMVTKMANGDANVDVICPSEYAIQKLMSLDLLQPIDKTKLTIDGVDTYANVNADILAKVDEVFGGGVLKDTAGNNLNMNDYMVPYMYGTLGIMYNTAYVTEEDLATGWGMLWNESGSEDLARKILMKDSVRDAYVAGIMYLKERGELPAKYMSMSVQDLINCKDDEIIHLTEELFKSQKDALKGYEVDLGKDDMVSEMALMDLAWSGDAMYAIEEAAYEDVELVYYVPEIGSNIWYDGWVIPKTCANVDAAHMFIAFLNTPYNGMRNMIEIGYSSAVSRDVLLADPDALQYLVECYFDEESEEDMAALDELYAVWDSDGFSYDALPQELKDYVDEFFAWDVRYPDVTDKLGVMMDFGSRNEDIVSMWERVKATGGWNSTVAWWSLGICVFVIAGILLAVYLKSNVLFTRYRVVSDK